MRRPILLTTVAILALAPLARAEQATTDTLQPTIDKGLAFLQKQEQADGSFGAAGDPPAVTALALKAFAGEGKSDLVKKGFDNLLTFQKPDGGIYRDALANYNTAIAITALAAAKNPQYQPAIDKAVGYLRTLQWDDTINNVPATERKPIGKDDPRYGGFGYGNNKKSGRPDGSNLQIALDALHDAGVKPDDPAYKAAVTFATRLQNHSETNDQNWAGNDGGFIYTDFDEGKPSSAAGTYDEDGKTMVRSYGSMTYAGLKSMIYAGLSKDDPRVKAAWSWIEKNYTWDSNPGIKFGAGGKTEDVTGLYYYFHTASRALAAYGQPIITDSAGVKHDWRVEMIDKLTKLQKPDGSWLGLSRWMEDKPMIATSMAVLALEEAKADLAAHPAGK